MADDIRVAPSSEPSISSNLKHLYVSTYCQHGYHGDCRLSCKICKAPCLCPCHVKGSAEDLLRLVLKSDYVTENLRADIRAALAAPSGAKS